MFTGIVTDVGRITAVETLAAGRRFTVATAYWPETIEIGASISCAGVCLTVVDKAGDGAEEAWFSVEAWEEALRLTTASDWAVGDPLNLERALRVGDELGGHWVLGHVDATAEVVEVRSEGEAVRFRLRAPHELARYIARKGSVCLDGTSLTVNDVCEASFDVLLIRHSLAVTTWNGVRDGDRINLEVDPIARYAERLFAAAATPR